MYFVISMSDVRAVRQYRPVYDQRRRWIQRRCPFSRLLACDSALFASMPYPSAVLSPTLDAGNRDVSPLHRPMALSTLTRVRLSLRHRASQFQRRPRILTDWHAHHSDHSNARASRRSLDGHTPRQIPPRLLVARPWPPFVTASLYYSDEPEFQNSGVLKTWSPPIELDRSSRPTCLSPSCPTYFNTSFTRPPAIHVHDSPRASYFAAGSHAPSSG